MKEAISFFIPDLILKQKSAKIAEAKIYTGWEGIKTANEDIINTLKKGEEWLSMGFKLFDRKKNPRPLSGKTGSEL